MVKAGIIGLGSIARKHISALRAIDPDAQIYALRRPGSRLSDEGDGVTDIFSAQELLELRLDFLLIANPTDRHYRTIQDFAASGIPLFIEKPLFDSLPTACPQVSQPTYIGCNLRFLACLQYVRGHIGPMRVNEVNAYCGSYLPGWRPGADWRQTYSANREMGGGVHIDLIHELDYIYWLWGNPSRVTKTFRNVSSLEISACDYANYCLEYEGFAASVVLNYYRRDYKRTLEIVFEDETWLVDLAANRITCGDRTVFESSENFADTYIKQMQYFLGLIEGNAPSFNSLEEAYRVLQICLTDGPTK